MKILIIYDNTVFNKDLESDWGFAAYIEAYGKSILFDTGANGEILLRNMQKLKIDPLIISDVFISHSHFDHIGGLSHFLNLNSDITLHAPTSFRGVRTVKKVVYYDKPVNIYRNFYTSGELDGIEQALAVETGRGLLIVAGCSHPNMDNIIEAFAQFGRIYGIIGGLHGFDQYELFNSMEIICPTHCTQHKKEIKMIFPDKYIEGGAGRLIEI